MSKQKIRLADVESARRALQQAPEHQAEEVTKREAIRSLREEIYAAQKKGHSLENIAGLLTGSGIAVSKVLLKSYLSHAQGTGSGKRKKKPKESPRREKGRSAAALPTSSSTPAGTPGGISEHAVSTNQEQTKAATASVPLAAENHASELRVAAKGALASAQANPSVDRPKARAIPEPGNTRPSAFRPRKDSDDI